MISQQDVPRCYISVDTLTERQTGHGWIVRTYLCREYMYYVDMPTLWGYICIMRTCLNCKDMACEDMTALWGHICIIRTWLHCEDMSCEFLHSWWTGSPNPEPPGRKTSWGHQQTDCLSAHLRHKQTEEKVRQVWPLRQKTTGVLRCVQVFTQVCLSWTQNWLHLLILWTTRDPAVTATHNSITSKFFKTNFYPGDAVGFLFVLYNEFVSLT